MLQGILIVVAFLVVAALMMTKKIPTLLALPLMAVVICIIAGVPMFGKNADGAEIGWLTTVFEAGTVRMGSAIMATIFGAWLGQLMNKTGVTENIIKKSAELGGDRPLVVTLIMVVATAVLFTTLSGLGSIIMVGSIVLPILISVGVPAASAACIFLMAFTTGVRGGLAMITPLIPIVLVAFLKVPVTPAFTVGIIWCLLFTSQSFSKAMNQMTKTCYDGITDAGPAVILMVGIGILFLAVTNASVKEVLNPLLLAIVPTSRVPYIIFFAILAPLALYRGPMNMFGLGSGIAALIIGLGTLNPLAVMAAFLAAERIQCGGDPTNTQNVWTANFCEVDVNTCTKKMLPYLWAVSIVGVILGAMLYF